MRDNETMLSEEIKSQIDKVGKLETGTQEHSMEVANLERLYKLELESKKVKMEAEANEREEKFRRDQLKSDTISRNVKTGVEAFAAITTFATAIWFGVKGFKFEETGTYVSQTFKNVFGIFRPKK